MADARRERVALLALLRTRAGAASWPELTADVLAAGSAEAVLRGDDQALLPDPAVDEAYEVADRELAGWENAGLRLLTVLDDEYPARLLGIHQAPPLLFVEGQVLADDPGVSVVGSRKATQRGLDIAAGIATALVADGLTVISGLAAGVDTAAHTAALDANGRTVAVLGTGLNRCYPASNAPLQAAIAKAGLLLSQFVPDAPPQKHTFPMRNATMSGYGIATVVVEAGEHSGARIQARVAVQHGRPVVLTDLVVSQTDWGRQLVGRPGVHVASSTSEVVEVVRAIRDEPTRTALAVQRLAGV